MPSDKTNRPGNTPPRSLVGLPVYTPDGEKLGVVSDETVPQFLAIRKGVFFKHDAYIPEEAIGAIEPDGIYLLYTKEEVFGRDWAAPPTSQSPTMGSIAAHQQRPPKEAIQNDVTQAGMEHEADTGGALPG
jgi:hypothetical protein